MYQVRNRFQQGLAAEVGGPGPIRQISLGGGATSPNQQAASAGPVTGSGPGYAAANLARPESMGGAESAEEKAYGNAQNKAQSAEEFGRNRQQFEFNQALKTKPGAYAGQSTQGTSVTNGQFNASDEQRKYMEAQIAAAAKANAVKKYARGGRINEPVKGVGQRTGNPYLFGEKGPEQVTPIGTAQGANAPKVPQEESDLSEEQMLMQLQQILGRRVFAKNRKPIRGSNALSPEMSDTNKNDAKAVNSPVLRLGEDEIRQIARSGQHGNLIQALAEAERRGGIEVVSGSGLGASQGVGSSSAGSAVEDNATPNEQAIMDEEAAAAAEAGGNEYFPGFDDPSSPDYVGTPPAQDPNADMSDPFGDPNGQLPAPGVYNAGTDYNENVAPGTPEGFGEPAGSGVYDHSTFNNGPSDLSDPFGDMGGQMASPVAPTYSDPAPTTALAPSDLSDPFGDMGGQMASPVAPTYSAPAPTAPAYSQQNYNTADPFGDPGGQMAAPSAYTPPTQQSFDQAALDKMLADALARSGYGTTSGTASIDEGISTPPSTYTSTPYSATTYNTDDPFGDPNGQMAAPGAYTSAPAETEAERMMREATSGIR